MEAPGRGVQRALLKAEGLKGKREGRWTKTDQEQGRQVGVKETSGIRLGRGRPCKRPRVL